MNRGIAFRCILMGIAGGMAAMIWGSIPGKDMTAAEILLFQGFSWFNPNFAMILELSFQYVPFFLFQMLCARRMSDYFLTSGIFFFSRCTQREKWFIKECAKLAADAVLFVFFYFGTGIAVVSCTGNVIWDKAGVILAIYSLILFSEWLFFCSLLMNLAAIWKGEVAGFVISAAVQYLCIFSFKLCERINEAETLNRPGWLYAALWGNPMSHLIVRWHSSVFAEVSAGIDLYGFGIDLNLSVLLFLAGDFILLWIGTVYIKKADLFIQGQQL